MYYIMSIIQFSPIRTGSTVIYNYLLELNKRPTKVHSYSNNTNAKYIITIRHPYNSIISVILRENEPINADTLQKQTDEYLQHGGKSIANNNFDGANHCILFYEEFVNNHDVILNKFEQFFNETYSIEKKNKMKAKLNIESVKNFIDDKNLTNFGEWDKQTKIHGRHISEYNGNTNYKELLSESEINLLKQNDTLNKIVDKYYNN